jgi:hypothetical protein
MKEKQVVINKNHMRFLNPAKDSDQQGNFGDSLCKDY